MKTERGDNSLIANGKALLAELSKRLTRDYGKGFDKRKLFYMRQFYLTYPKLNVVRSQSTELQKVNAPRALIIYIPLTHQNRGSQYEVSLGHLSWLANESVANVQGIGSLPPPNS